VIWMNFLTLFYGYGYVVSVRWPHLTATHSFLSVPPTATPVASPSAALQLMKSLFQPSSAADELGGARNQP
jgi:hypothetical protein